MNIARMWLVGGVVALQAAPPIVDPSEWSAATWERVVLSLVTVVTTWLGFWFTLRRDKQRREFDLLDRKLAREVAIEEQKQIAAKLAAKVEHAHQEAVARHDQTDAAIAETSRKVDEATLLTADALRAANNFNAKLAKVTALFDEPLAKRIDQTTQETKGIVKETREILKDQKGDEPRAR